MIIGHTTAPDRCPRCLRTKREAIADHLRSGDGCDCPDCPFRNEIQLALTELANKPTFSFGPVRKPKFTFSKPKDDHPVRIFFRKINKVLNEL